MVEPTIGAGGDYELRRPENKIMESHPDNRSGNSAIDQDLRLADPPPSLAKAMKQSAPGEHHNWDEDGGTWRWTRYVHVVDPDYVEPETVTTTTDESVDGKITPNGTSTPWCSICGKTGITFPHSCYPDINKVPDLTTRFDPYEALDLIYDVLSCCGEKEVNEPRDGSVNLPWGDAETIRNQLHALRAYITGMER